MLRETAANVPLCEKSVGSQLCEEIAIAINRPPLTKHTTPIKHATVTSYVFTTFGHPHGDKKHMN